MRMPLRSPEAPGVAVDPAPERGRWPHVLAAAVVAAQCARWAYVGLAGPQRYAEPIVGNLAWTGGSKSSDYAAPLALVGGFLVALVLSSALSARLARRIGAAAASRLDALLLVATAPAGAWLAGLLTTMGDSFALLDASAAAIGLVLAAGALLSLRGEAFWARDGARFSRVLDASSLVVPAVWLAVSAVAVALSRLRALRHGSPLTHPTVDQAIWIAAGVAAAALAALVLAGGTAERVERALRRALLALQIAFPGFFLVLVPRPWEVGGRTRLGYPLGALAWLAVGALVVAALATLARRARDAGRAPPGDALALFPALSVVAVLLFLKAPPVGLPHVPPIGLGSLPPDDYHFGEILVPWWSLVRHHLVPFADYAPARGLVNYAPGAVAALLLDGKAASFSAVWPFVYAGVLLVAVPALRAATSTGWAALALLLALPANGISEIDALVTVFLALACRGLAAWTPSRWFVAWVAAGTAIVLFAPGQGGLGVLATAPLGLWMAVRGLREERRRFLRALGATAGVAALLCAATPLGRMVLGAIRYGAEQSAVNSVAHGIAWAASFRTSGVNPWLYEAVRGSWLLVALWAGVLVVDAVRARRSGAPSPALPYAVAVLILGTLFVFRAAGRIDAGPSRLGLASVWAFSLLLPLLLHASTPPRRRAGAVLAWVTLAGLVLPHFGGLATGSAEAYEPVRNVPPALAERREAGPAELRLGSAIADPGHVARLAAARAVVDRVLDPGETYLDLTGRHAQYFFLGRRPPIETGAVYNLVAEAQQRRAIEALRRDPPPAVLVAAANIIHDGGPIGLRSHLLYRYVLQLPRHEVVTIGDQVWLLRDERIARLSRDPALAHAVHPIDERSDDPLHRVLGVQELGAIPASWGASATSLERGMRLVRALQPVPSPSVEALGDGRFRPAGPRPAVALDLSGAALDGREAGILSLEFACERAGGPPPALEVRWAAAGGEETALTRARLDGRDGRLLVPLDASPAWLLARRIGSLRLEVAGGACRTFRVAGARLLQRHGADAAPDAHAAR